MNINF